MNTSITLAGRAADPLRHTPVALRGVVNSGAAAYRRAPFVCTMHVDCFFYTPLL